MADSALTTGAVLSSVAVPFQALLESLPAAAYVCDREGRLVYHNRRAVDLWGRWPRVGDPGERYCGAYALALSDGTPVPPERCWAARTLTDGRPREDEEVIVIRPDGEHRVALAYASPLRDDAGHVTGSVNVLVDVTEQRSARTALERTERSFRAFFDSVAIGTAQIGPNGYFQEVNDRFCEITGYTREDLRSMTPFDLDHPEDRDEDYLRVHEYVSGSGVYRNEKRYVRKDGTVIWVHAAANLLRDDQGRPLQSIAIVEDITERKLAEQALQDADRLKDEFLAMLAHELRNPLAPLRNAVELLRDPSAQNGGWCREIIERQVSHLTRLIDDLLDVSRITRDKLEVRRERTTLAEVLAAAIEASRPLLDRCEQRLVVEELPEPLPLDGDLVRLTQVFTNLLTNAAKFTEKPGTIRISAVRHAESVRVSVKDSGVGMTSEELPRIFDMFFQGECRARSLDGLGIGLSLVRRIVELHGGTIEARSEGRGLGSELLVSLPLAARCGQSAAASPAMRGATGKRVLVVDDNRDGADSLSRLLALMGYDAVAEYDGYAALERAKVFRADVVLLDLGMPGLDGYEVCRRLRAQCGADSPSIVAVTGWGREQDRIRTEDAGFDAHLVKPVERAALERLLA